MAKKPLKSTKIVPDGCVASQDELALKLNVSSRKITYLMKREGRPENVKGRFYDVEKWREFIEQEKDDREAEKDFTNEEKEKLADVRLRKEKAIAEKEELNVAKIRGELIEKVAVRMTFQSAWNFELGCLRSVLGSYPGLNPADAQQIFDDFVKLCREYKTELIDHAESQSEV